MPQATNNEIRQSRFQRLKEKFLALALRTQIFLALGMIALITVVAVGATTIINVGNSNPVSGVRLRFEPVDATVAPGDILAVNLVLDTAGRSVSAVSAVFDIDTSLLALSGCVSLTDCPDISIGSNFEWVAERSVTGSEVRLAVGTSSPVNGSGILVANISFDILACPAGSTTLDAAANFNTTDSAVVADDGEGTNILEEVNSEEWTVDCAAAGALAIIDGPSESIICSIPEARIDWQTNLESDSQVAYYANPCPSFDWNNTSSQCGATITTDSVADIIHNITLTGLSDDTSYYYRVRSTDGNGATAESGENIFSTSCISVPTDTLEITNLSVEPFARSAVVSWNTNLLADSTLTVDGLTFTDTTLTLSHSLRALPLLPNTQYTATVTSATGSETATDSITFTTLDEDLSLDSNLVLQVQRDRVCGEWLSCASSVEVLDKNNDTQSFCFDRTLCSELDPDTGVCINPKTVIPGTGVQADFRIAKDDPGQSTIDNAKLLSGYSKAGATWQGFDQSGQIPGYFPYASMTQLGSSQSVPNKDFETKFVFPWLARFNRPGSAELVNTQDRTDLSRDLNRVLAITPHLQPEGVSGAKVPLGRTLRSGRQYYVTFDVRSGDENINELFVQLGFHGDSDNYAFTTRATDLIPISSGWQRAVAGPLEVEASDLPNNGEQNYLAFLVDTGGLKGPIKQIYIDNVRIEPVLNVGPGVTDPNTHISRSCRSYPADDAPTCRFFDANSGTELQGWEGFCLQTDPRNPRRCIQWLPVDLIAGSSSALTAYAQAGYGTDQASDRLPLYYCSEAKGNAPYERSTQPLVTTGATFLKPTSGNWNNASGLKDFDIISDNKGNRLTGVKGLHDYEIEQIVIRVVRAQASDWQPGKSLSLNQSNKFETAWCGGKPKDGKDVSCSDDLNTYLNPNSKFYWRKVVDGTVVGRDRDDVCFAFGSGVLGGPDNNNNLWGARAIFNKDTGTLESIEAGLCDGSGDDGWFEADIVFYLREWCSEVAQAVTPFGDNTAWAGRIHDSNYTVPGLGYSADWDLAPFGGIVAPEPDFDPSQWDGSGEPGRQPLFVEPANKEQFFQKPYQTRASSPYGISFDNSSGTCSVGNLGTSCSSNSECSLEINPGNKSQGECRFFGFSDGQQFDNGLSNFDWQCVNGPRDGNYCNVDADCQWGSAGVCGIVTGKLSGATCVSGSKLGASCATHEDCGRGDDGSPGRCSGAVPPANAEKFFSAINNVPGEQTLSNIFARSQQVWEWDDVARRYLSTPSIGCQTSGKCVNNGAGWDITGDTNIASPPKVNNIKVKGGSGSLVNPAGAIEFAGQSYGSVTVEFNSDVDSQQLPLVRYTVDWGDGNTSEETNLHIVDQPVKPHVLTHTYVTEGTFTPRIQIEDNWGWCSGTGGDNYAGDGTDCTSWDKVPKDVIIRAPSANLNPIAEATATPISGDAPLTVSFTGSASVDIDGTITSFSWSFGDGGSDSVADPSYTYNTPGTYTATLTVTDNDGATGTASVTITVNSGTAPTITRFESFDGNNIQTTTFETNQRIDFELVATDVQDSTLDLLVDFADGSTYSDPAIAIGQTITFSSTAGFSTAGFYTVIATVTDSSGLTGTASIDIEVTAPPATNQSPIASFTWIPAGSTLTPFPVDFDASASSDPDGTITLYTWDWGDGTTSETFSVPTASHDYAVVGDYTVTLTVEDDQGATGSISQLVSLTATNNPPNAPSNLEQFFLGVSSGEGTESGDTTPSFSFTISDPDAGQLVGYDFQIATDSGFSNLVTNFSWPGPVSDPATFDVLPADALPAGNYYWRVRAVDDQGAQSAWVEFGSAGIADFRVNWWNLAYGLRQRLVVSNNQASVLAAPFPTQAVVDTQTLILNSQMRSDGNDLRIVYDDGSNIFEIDHYIPSGSFDSASTFIWFSIQANIAASGSDVNYWLYYDNSVAGSPLANANNVFQPGFDGNTVALYNFESGGGTTLVDSSGNSINGTLTNGTTWSTGRFARGLDFDGVNDYVEIAHNAALALPQGTIEIWALPNLNSSNNMTLFAKDREGGGTGGHIYLEDDENDSALPGFWKFRLQDSQGNNTNSYVYSNNDAIGGIWRHYAVTWGSAGMHYYINGAEQGSGNTSITSGIENNVEPLLLGANNDRNPSIPLENFLNGRLDGLRISNIQRTSFPYATVTSDPTVTVGNQEVIALGTPRVAGAADINLRNERTKVRFYEVWTPFVSLWQWLRGF